MAFTIANWACVSSSMNQGQETVIPYGGSSTVLNAPNLFTYGSPTDTVATIEGANYFLSEYASLCVGDIIIAGGTDANIMLIVLTSSSTGVTTGSFTPAGNVGTSNIVNNAVTYAKIQQASADTLIGNPTNGTANVEEITLGNGLSFNGTTLQVSNGLTKQTSVAMTLAQWNGMYATPFQVLAAPGAGLMNVIESVYVNFIYGSASLTAGGAVGLQYGATAHLAGEVASVTEAATDYTSAAANTMFRFGGSLSTGAVTSNAINTAITISNATQAFATGTGGSFEVIVNYRTVSAS